jgi:hypothetical protein
VQRRKNNQWLVETEVDGYKKRKVYEKQVWEAIEAQAQYGIINQESVAEFMDLMNSWDQKLILLDYEHPGSGFRNLIGIANGI